MGLIDEKYHRHCRCFDFCNHRLQTIFKFTFDAGTRLQQAQIECANHHLLQVWRYSFLYHALRKAFHNSCFSYPCFTGQNGIVLSSAQKNVNDLPDLSIASAHGVNLSLPGQGRQINRELI